MKSRETSIHRWDKLATGTPPVLLYWYRQSPRPLFSRGAGARVGWSQPPWMVSGMTAVLLDTRGRLLSFYAVAPQVDPEDAAPPPAPDFAPLFAAAELDPARFHEVPSRWSPPVASDLRRAWEGSWAEEPSLPLRIEAASYRGRPVTFYQVLPWTRPERDQAAAFSRTRAIANGLWTAFLLSLVAAGVVLARRHGRAGRADRAGANRLALGVFALGATSYALGAHHVPWDGDELELIIRGSSSALLVAAVVWLLYMALEPIVRRLWPHALISWTRLLTRGPFDPLVGRDALGGAAAGSVIAALVVVSERLPAWLGLGAEISWSENGLAALLGLRYGLAAVLAQPLPSVSIAVGSFLLLALLRLLLRREGLAAAGYIVVVGTLQALRWELPFPFALPLAALITGTFVVVALRLGLLAFVVTAFTIDVILNLSTTSDFASWTSEPTRLASLVVLALAVSGFRLARRPAPAHA